MANIRYTNIDLPKFQYLPKLKMDRHNHIPTFPREDGEFTAQNWPHSTRYLYAIDLFNNGYYFEVHEILEEIWMETGKHSEIGIFVQGIIQLSVALLKNIEGNPKGVKLTADKALPKLMTQKGIFLGIKVEDLINQYNSIINSEAERMPVIELHF